MKYLLLTAILLLVPVLALPADIPSDVFNRLKNEISQFYGGAEVELLNPMRVVSGEVPELIQSVKLVGNDANGNMCFRLTGSSEGQIAAAFEGCITYKAWVDAKIALNRIHPGQPLSEDAFRIQKIDVSTGMGREYRGVLFRANQSVSGYESRQTVLEGQFLTTTAIQKAPDIRRGDAVQIHLISGGLVLTTSGVAEEPAYLSKQLRIMTTKTKRELLGRLKPGKIVEVQL